MPAIHPEIHKNRANAQEPERASATILKNNMPAQPALMLPRAHTCKHGLVSRPARGHECLLVRIPAHVAPPHKLLHVCIALPVSRVPQPPHEEAQPYTPPRLSSINHQPQGLDADLEDLQAQGQLPCKVQVKSSSAAHNSTDRTAAAARRSACLLLPNASTRAATQLQHLPYKSISSAPPSAADMLLDAQFVVPSE